MLVWTVLQGAPACVADHGSVRSTDRRLRIKISELRSALAQKILIEDLDEGADVERAEIRKSIMNSLMVSTLGT